MDLQDNLISSKSRKRKGGWKAYAGSIVMHGLIVALILFMSASATHVVAKQEPIRAYLSQGAAPPPPPPPPPPPASTAKSAGSPAPKHVTQIQLPKPVQITPLTPPTEIPKEIPIPQPVQPVQLKIDEATTALPQPMMSSSSEGNGAGGDVPGAALGGVPGGVAGGVVGGTVGGEVGGTIGGQLGGVKGGVVGGELGGQLGGTGSGSAGKGAGDSSAPLRVGGDVKAPTVISKPEPKYTEPARKARVTGVVVVEAIINRQGHVEEVKVLKGLPMGLSEEAVEAVKRWRFKPGTLNGEPVDVIFSLTVNFKMD